jgi:hypothetical protein
MEPDMKLAALISADVLEFEKLLSKPLQLPEFVQRTASPRQLAVWTAAHKNEHLCIRVYLCLIHQLRSLFDQLDTVCDVQGGLAGLLVDGIHVVP